MTGGGKRQRPLLSALSLEDNIMKKVAIVTGSSRGIGYAIVRRLGRDGFRVVVSATGPQENMNRCWQG